MLFKLPPEVVMLAIDAHILQNKGTVGSVESRSLEVQRKQHQLAELVSAIIIKNYIKIASSPNIKNISK